MVALARLGFKTSFIGKVGADDDGQFVLEQFRQEKVNTIGVIVDKNMPTNKAFIWIDKPSGKKSIVLNGSKYKPVLPDEVAVNHVGSFKYLLIDGRDTAATFFLINWAKQMGAKIILDAGSPREKMEKLLFEVDYLVVSQHFCHQYLKLDKYEKAVKKLMYYGPQAAVITCGVGGCYGADNLGTYFQPAFNVNAVDTTGAGDVFHGAFIAGLLNKWTLPEILKFASAVAAIKCTQLGGRQGIPTFEQVINFIHSK